RARLEQHQAVVVDRRHLAEGLHRPVGGRLLVVGPDQHHLVGQACLLERPAHAQVAHQALGERRHPAERAEADHALTPASVAAKESSTWPQPWPWLMRSASESNGSWRKVSSVLSAPCSSKSRVSRVGRSCAGSPLSHWKLMTIRRG